MLGMFTANLVKKINIISTLGQGHQLLTMYLTLALCGLSQLWWYALNEAQALISPLL